MAIELKLLIDKDKRRVVYAESDKYFVDTLFSFLTETVGNVVRLSSKKSNLGCMDELYGSVEKLDSQYFQTVAVREMLLRPRSASEGRSKDLALRFHTELETYYICTWDCEIDGKKLISSVKNAQCRCGRVMSTEIYPKKSAPDVVHGGEGAFLEGNMRFAIADDLSVCLVTASTCLSQFSEILVGNWANLEAKNVNVSVEEAFHILKRSLVSNTPLTDVFLPKTGAREVAINITESFEDAAKERRDVSMNMRVKLVVSKSKNKVLFAESNADFVDLLFSFLTFPLGSIVKLLGPGSSIRCLENLYKSVGDVSSDESCTISEACSAMLLEPKLAPHWQCENQLLPVMEEGPRQIVTNGFLCTCCHQNAYDRHLPGWSRRLPESTTMNLINPKISGGTIECGGGFVKEKKTRFMITDALEVKPTSLFSCISIFEGMTAPSSDLQEHIVKVGEKEALSLLKASLSSTTVLSDVFCGQKLQPSEMKLNSDDSS